MIKQLVNIGHVEIEKNRRDVGVGMRKSCMRLQQDVKTFGIANRIILVIWNVYDDTELAVWTDTTMVPALLMLL